MSKLVFLIHISRAHLDKDSADSWHVFSVTATKSSTVTASSSGRSHSRVNSISCKTASIRQSSMSFTLNARTLNFSNQHYWLWHAIGIFLLLKWSILDHKKNNISHNGNDAIIVQFLDKSTEKKKQYFQKPLTPFVRISSPFTDFWMLLISADLMTL